MKLNNFIAFIFSLICLFSYSQKGTFLAAGYNFFPSRSYAEIAFQKRKINGYSFSFTLGAGQLGKRMYDNKTKDAFGRVFSPQGYGKTFFYTDNFGGNLAFSYSYQFVFSKVIRLDVGGMIIGEGYRHYYNSDLNDKLYVDGVLVDVDNEVTHYHFNFAFGFTVNSTFQIAKKSQLYLGINMPFHILNKDKFIIGSIFDPPLLGFEPVFKLGYIYKIAF